MATETIINRVCDVTGAKGDDVREVSLTLPIVDTDDNGHVDYSNGVTYKVVTIKLDAADKVMADVLSGILQAATPLFTENTTVKVKGERKQNADGENADADSDSDEPVIGSTEHMREWLRANGHTVGEKGRIAKKAQEAYWNAHKDALPNADDESDESESDDSDES